jgi:uncharacterized protein YegL
VRTEQVVEVTGVEQGQVVMPFYVVCDVSWSMKDDMGSLNKALQELWQSIIDEPVVDDVARISLLTFSDSASVAVRLGQAIESRPPQLTEQGGTNYGAGFRLLAETIEQDRQALKSQGYKIFGPCAFFLTDGEPLDVNWSDTFRATLTYDQQTGVGNKTHPVFVPFGFRDAPEQIMRQLAYPVEKGRWYHTRTSNVKDALDGVLAVIMRTVMRSTITASTPKPQLLLPAASSTSILESGPAEYGDFIN